MVGLKRGNRQGKGGVLVQERVNVTGRHTDTDTQTDTDRHRHTDRHTDSHRPLLRPWAIFFRRIARRRARAQSKHRVTQTPGDNSSGSSGSSGGLDEESWTDDELDGEEGGALAQEQKELVDKAAGVLSNVHDDFSDIARVASRFEQWKLSYPHVYNGAFISDSLKQILHPLISLELMSWSPLDPEAPEIESMPWFRTLFLFGADKDTHMLAEDDPDAFFLPQLIDMVLVPKVAGFLEFVYDPLSTTQTRAGAAVARHIHDAFHIDFQAEHGQVCQRVCRVSE